MTEQQLAEIEQRLMKRFDLRRSGLSVVDSEDRIICSCLHWGNNFATVTLQNFAEMFANAPTDIQALLAKVRRLTERLQYEETCHAEAREEVRRLNRMVDKACALIDGCPQFNTMDSSGNGNWFCKDKNYKRGKGQYADCWRKYLEEAAGNG